jgi:hypothetical protein
MITSALRRRSPVCGLAVLSAAACSVLLISACSGGSPAGHPVATRSPPPATSGATASATPAATTGPGTPGAPIPPARALPRCRTGQLSTAFTGLNAAMGGQRGMTLILTSHSGGTCYVYGYPGLAFYGSGVPMSTHLTWMKEPHTKVVLHPGGNAQALLTWRVNMDTPTPFNPDIVHVTPPGEYTYLRAIWPGGPVLGGNIISWPLRAAPAGPFPAGTGTVANPFNGMCMALAGNGTAVMAWKCSAGASSQQWTGYSDGTLRINGKCLDVTGPGVGAKVKIAACTGPASQKWEIGQVSSNSFGPIIGLGSSNVLTDPGGSSINGTQLQMGVNRGDQSGPWHVSFRHYIRH